MEGAVDISFNINKNFLNTIKETEGQFREEMLFSSAFLFYRRRKLSLGKAAEFAGISKVQFIEKLNAEGDFIFDYNEDEMDEIFEDAKKSL